MAGGVAAMIRDYCRFAGAGLWLALTLMLFGAFAEGVGIVVLVPLAAIAIGTGTGGGTASWLVRAADWLPSDTRFLAVLALFVAAMGARSVLLYLRDRELARLQAGYEASLRLRAAVTLARRGWRFAANVGQAGMQALLLTDVPRAALAVGEAQRFATGAIMLTVQLALAFFLSPALAAVSTIILLLGFLLSIRWTRRGVASGIALTERSEESTVSGFRFHAGLKAALAQGTAGQFLAEYESTLGRARREAVRFASDVASARQLAAFAAALAAASILYIGVGLVHLAFPLLIASVVLFARMVPPAQSLMHSAQYVAAFGASFSAVTRRLGGLDETGEKPPTVQRRTWGGLRLENAGYWHQPGLGLAGACLTLRPGEWIGIAGPSGSGKTTLVDLVAGLLVPQSGTVAVDGEELGAVLDSWRAGLAYVGQQGAVFDDSVRGNLLAEGAIADEAQLWAVLETVGLADRVRKLPDDLDERVGDRGSQLSGGELQRLTIARALLRRPSLLILDEATAALDDEGEASVLRGLIELDPRPAAILVAHRPSTLAHCDSILHIHHGTVEKSADSTYRTS